MKPDSNKVIELLRGIRHPESSQGIIEMDMVKSLSVTGDRIDFTLVSRKPEDPLLGSLKNACQRAITKQFGPDVHVDIQIEKKQVKGKTTNANALAGVRNIIAVASGKGGVGKSTVACNLAVALSIKGSRVALVDADIFGPSIPRMLGLMDARPVAHEVNGKEMIIPAVNHGVKILSIGFFIRPGDATIWRGPMASNFLKQMIFQGDWGEIDYMIIDLPPGTSDIHLTLVQEVNVTGAIIVSTPQEVALADAVKGISMFRGERISVPVLGLVENMAWFTPAELPDNRYYIFGKDGCKKLAESMNIPLLGQIPIVQDIREGGDNGTPTALAGDSPESKAFAELAERVKKAVDERNKNLPPTQRVKITK